MRVLYFTRDYTPHDHRFLTALAATPHEVFSLRLERRGAQREDRPLPPEIIQIPWRGGTAPARWQDGPALLGGLRRVIREVRPDLIHAGSIQTAAFLTALAGFKPLVSMSWGSDLLKDADASAAMRFATRYTLARTSVLVGDCKAVRDKAVSMGFPADRVVLFPWGVDLKRFCPGPAHDFRARLGWQDAFVLLSNRAWEPLYGVDGVVRAFIRAAGRIPALRLLLLGNGSQASQLHKMVADADLLNRVHFAGQVSQADLPTYYRAADLYLSASHSDGSSVSLMEALACGCPVLVSDIPGNQEWVEPGAAGWRFPDGDWDALQAGIERAYAEQDSLPRLAAAARALAEQRADWSANFQKLLGAYQLALDLHAGRVD